MLSIVAATAALFAIPSVAAAAPPDPSAAEVSPTTVAQGETFNVTVEVYNPQSFTIAFAKAAIYGQESPIVDIADLESCTGASAACAPYLSSFRAPVGDLGPGESRTVVFTLRVKETASPGQVALLHQLVGDNYSFATLTGPVVTVTGDPQAADLRVSLDASPRGVLTSKITYTISVTNTGPANATGIRLGATYAAGLSYASSTDCTRVSGTRTVNCDIASLPAGATATARFSARDGLLSLGSFTTTAQRTQSTPADPNPSNDTARRSCSALTGLLVRC